ncbi:SDR family NAD(P)-dependent oxidoreductase [Pseudonocardia zijingensis]|jgi:NAD(P)-dependent dehydrogenase (short-subunit alcohol dehydrogenase family)|uniref:SDR family NAD(P)-dependent oxidoreductase n=1 Tax=Pseudonocardia zijingensis TaxID=153376 RepID=A0ABN1NGA0_9PSEU
MAEPDTREASLAQHLFRVEGRGAVVTGAGSGLGLATARVLARNGARVTLADVDEAGLQRAAADLAEEGCAVRTAVADVADRGAVDALMADAAAWDSGLHIAFANAGISAGPGFVAPEGRLDAVDDERWQRVLDVNLTGVLHTVRAAAHHMVTGYGRIVVISSLAGIRADPLVGYAYTATKAGVVALVRNAALELAPRGILVNAIAPGAFVTNIGKANPGRGRVVEEFARAAALNRLGDPAELEGLALFLASPASSYVTGAVLPIDGGATTGRNPV